MRALIRCVRMPWVSAFISNHICQAVTSESWFIDQNVNQVREKITEFSGLKHFVSSLASQNRDFWLQMAITQGRIIKDVQILAYTKKLKLNVTPSTLVWIKNNFYGGEKYERYFKKINVFCWKFGKLWITLTPSIFIAWKSYTPFWNACDLFFKKYLYLGSNSNTKNH